MKNSPGRIVYGLAVMACGVCGLVWHHFDALAGVPYRAVLVDIAGITLVLGGAGILWPRMVRCGAAAVGAVYFAFALLGIPFILKQPLVYNGYGNVFEQLSLVAGAVILHASFGSIASARLAWAGYYTFGVCVISFALEQVFYLSATAGFVPKWMPLGKMYWAVATTVAFGLAALALLTGIKARLAAWLTAAMILGFLLLVWVPALLADLHSSGNWSEAMETFAIAATAWVVAEFLGRRRARA